MSFTRLLHTFLGLLNLPPTLISLTLLAPLFVNLWSLCPPHSAFYITCVLLFFILYILFGLQDHKFPSTFFDAYFMIKPCFGPSPSPSLWPVWALLPAFPFLLPFCISPTTHSPFWFPVFYTYSKLTQRAEGLNLASTYSRGRVTVVFVTWLLFRAARKWNQPGYRSADEWVRKCDTCPQWNNTQL